MTRPQFCVYTEDFNIEIKPIYGRDGSPRRFNELSRAKSYVMQYEQKHDCRKYYAFIIGDARTQQYILSRHPYTIGDGRSNGWKTIEEGI